MIPPDWKPHFRARDDELVGYLVPAGSGVVPVTLFGYPLAEPSDEAGARLGLESEGLAVLADPWWLELTDGQCIRVKIREVSQDRVSVVVDDFGYGANLADAFLLDVPEAGRLTLSRRR